MFVLPHMAGMNDFFKRFVRKRGKSLTRSLMPGIVGALVVRRN